MTLQTPVWLIVNSASGSNTAEAVAQLQLLLAQHGFGPERIVSFPVSDLPTPAVLDAAGVRTVVVFTGDGTINALVTGLYGWSGQILALPGGTMNLLAKTLHGEVTTPEIVQRVAAGAIRAVRVPVVRSVHGDALVGVMAGPATGWNQVREALREGDLLGIAEHAVAAIGESAAGPMVACHDPGVGRDEGYALLMLTPTDDGMLLQGYFASTFGEYALQGLALLKRDFREGPHDDLGTFRHLALHSRDGSQVSLLIDGESSPGGNEVEFDLAMCQVDLLATADETWSWGR